MIESQKNPAEQSPDSLDNSAHYIGVINRLADVVSRVVPVINRQVEVSREHMEEAMGQLTTRFVSLVNHVNDGEENTQKISEEDRLQNNKANILGEINEIMVLLQFQDRVSQIMSNINSSLNTVSQCISDERQAINAGEAGVLNLEEILEKLEASYVTEEERQAHSGESVKTSEESSLDFF